MKLNSVDLSESIEIMNGQITNLVIENKKEYRKYLTEFSGLDNFAENIIFMDGTNRIDTKHIEFIVNPVNISLNNKNLIKCIEKILLENVLDNYSKWIEIKGDIEHYLSGIEKFVGYNLLKDDLSPEKIIKIVNYKIEEDLGKDPEDNLLEYMDLVSNLLGTKLFIFNDFLDMFDEEEIVNLKRTFELNEYTVLLLSTKKYINIDNVFIIDKDLCLI